MFRSFKLGRAFGIPLYLHPTFLLLPLYILFQNRHDGLGGILFGQGILLSLFGCVLLHELGHALMARYFGIPTRDITLYPIGGVARLESTGGKPHEEVCIALAGPAVNLVIVFLLLPLVVTAFFAGSLTGMSELLGGEGGFLTVLASYLAVLCVGNGILLLFNLVPAFPMDGGRVLRAILAMRLGQLRATEVAATVALLAAGGLALLGMLWPNPGLVVVSLFVAFAGQQELAALKRQEAERRMMVEVMPVVEELSPGLHGFTGFLWDRENRVWIHWVNGQPVEVR